MWMKVMAISARALLGFAKKILAIIKEEELAAIKRIEERVVRMVVNMVSDGKREVIETVKEVLPSNYA